MSRATVVYVFPGELALSGDLGLGQGFGDFLPTIPSTVLGCQAYEVAFPLFCPLYGVFAVVSYVPDSARETVVTEFTSVATGSGSLGGETDSFNTTQATTAEVGVDLVLPTMPTTV